MSRPPSPANLPAGSRQRSDHSVRQLPAHPVLRAATAAHRAGGRPHRTGVNHESQASLFDPDPAAPASAIANIDGGSRGNPGPAAFGAFITLPDGQNVEIKGFI